MSKASDRYLLIWQRAHARVSHCRALIARNRDPDRYADARLAHSCIDRILADRLLQILTRSSAMDINLHLFVIHMIMTSPRPSLSLCPRSSNETG